jgi:hypothetical protein
MKAAGPTTSRPRAGRLGRALLALGILALVLGAWQGWSSSAMQAALEGLWAFCSAR